MKQFLQVLSFELKNFINGKWYKVSTVLVCVLVTVVMFVPRFLDLGSNDSSQEQVNDSSMVLGLYDPDHIIENQELLKSGFPNADWVIAKSQEEIEKGVRDHSIKAGFVITAPTEFQYLVLDSSMNDSKQQVFTSLLSTHYRTTQLQDRKSVV